MVKVHPGISVAEISGCITDIDGIVHSCMADINGGIDGEGTPKSWHCSC